MAKQAAEQSTGRWLAETALLVLAAVVLAQLIRTFVVEPFVIPSGSMIPTIEIKDRVLADKMVYRFVREPQAGDIVVFDDPSGEFPTLIKRVIAVGGQTVDLQDGAVVVDGKKLDEPYTYGKPSEPQVVPMPVKIPEGSIWVMGDNRTGSTDARTFGPVAVSTVHGRAFWTYWPLSRFGALK